MMINSEIVHILSHYDHKLFIILNEPNQMEDLLSHRPDLIQLSSPPILTSLNFCSPGTGAWAPTNRNTQKAQGSYVFK